MKRITNQNFTYYGDLLGTSELYSIHGDAGSRRLRCFYDLVFEKFLPLQNDSQITGGLFSDSFYITGTNIELVLKTLSSIYYELLKQNIFLRGAIVEGALYFEPRIELNNLSKRLPEGDVLFRAVQLEKSTEGARLLIEKQLARLILGNDLYDINDYINYINNNSFQENDIRRKIVYNNEYHTYEYLWPLENRDWLDNIHVKKEEVIFLPSYAKKHHKATIKLLKIAEVINRMNR
jgi:hypothetical protein